MSGTKCQSGYYNKRLLPLYFMYIRWKRQKVQELVSLKEANFTIEGSNLHIQFYQARGETVLTLTWFM